MATSLDRCLALSSSTQVAERLASLRTLETYLVSKSAAVPDVAALVRALLKRLMDSREACRVLACQSLLHLTMLYDYLSHDCLPLLIPVIKHRLAGDTEPSEVQRRNLLRLVDAIGRRFVVAVPMYIGDIVDILAEHLSDRDPDVALQSCNTLTGLAQNVPGALTSKSIACIHATLPLLKHRRAGLRCAALEVIDAFMYFGAAETIRTLAAFREANVVPIASFYGPEIRTNYFALLVDDPQFKVRSRFYKMIQRWSLDLSERFDYETLLAPYLFSGFFDDHDDIRISTIATIEACGRQYMKDNEDQLYDENRFGPSLEKQDPSVMPLILPPLICRPNLGARVLVRSQMPRLLPPVLMEICDWKESTRRSSIALVRMLLLYAEEKAAPHAVDILNAMSSGDDGVPLCQMALDCARLIGHNIDVAVWMPFITVIGDPSRKRFLEVTMACLRGADREQISLHQDALQTVIAGLHPGEPIKDYLNYLPDQDITIGSEMSDNL